jgi:hypothetical protein
MFKYLNGLLEKTLELAIKQPSSPSSPASPSGSPSLESKSTSKTLPLDIPAIQVDEDDLDKQDPLSSSYYLKKLPTVLKKIPSPTFSSPRDPYEIPSEKEIASYYNSSRITHNQGEKGAFSRLSPKDDKRASSSTKGSPTNIPVWLNWSQGGETVYVTGSFKYE